MGKIGKLPEGYADFVQRLTLMKHEAMTMGLYKTGHALEEPITVIGYEVAEILEGKRGDHLQDHPDLPVFP